MGGFHTLELCGTLTLNDYKMLTHDVNGMSEKTL